MSAKVQPNPWGGWNAYCAECNTHISGSAAAVDLWADIHNEEIHGR